MANLSLRIAFELPNDRGRYWFERDSEDIIKETGTRTRHSKLTDDVRRAHRFTPDSAVAFRDRFRLENPNCRVYIEDPTGTPVFERDPIAPPSPEDERKTSWYSPDDLPGLGWIITPGFRPEGPVWYVRPCDVPSLSDRVGAVESVFASTPAGAVERARALWGSSAQPIPNPYREAADDVELRRVINSIKRGPVRKRPGDIMEERQ